jgi:predicted Zn-dependent protease
MMPSTSATPAAAPPDLATETARLDTDPTAAFATAEAALAQIPDLKPAQLLAGQALRRLGRLDEAVTQLAVLANTAPDVPAACWELAQAAAGGWARNIWNARASIVRPIGRGSSTRCLTTGSMSGLP